MERKLSYGMVRCCLHMRVAAGDFMDYDVTSLIPDHIQQKLFQDLTEIAECNPYYVKLFLSRYIQLLESSDELVNDEIYELYCSPCILGATPLPPTATDTLNYTIDGDGNTVTITETPKIISGAGTTGLRTWEAALYLLTYLNGDSTTKPDLAGKTIVELGSGTGLVSLALLKNHYRHKFDKAVLTDGDSALIDNLAATFALNDLPAHVHVSTQQLVWGTTDPRESSTFVQPPPQADIVVAADVTYDALVVPQLTATLGDFFRHGATEAYIAATIRNVSTIEAWENAVLKCFVWDICSRCLDPHGEATVGWYRRGTPEIRVYRLKPRGQT